MIHFFHLNRLAASVLGLCLATLAQAQSPSAGTFFEKATLSHPGSQPGAGFGWNCSIDGDRALIGAPFENGAGVQSGAAYLVEYSDGWWAGQQMIRLAPADASANQNFGVSVALSGDIALIGALGDNGGVGAAYVFEKIGGAWIQTSKVNGVGPNFGVRVALSGTTAVVGSPYAFTGYGAVWVFQKLNGSWTYTAGLTAPDGAANDHFGRNVSIGGNVIAVGAPDDDDHGNGSGSAYIFERSGLQWNFVMKCAPPDLVAGDAMGSSVAASPTTVIVGAPYNGLGSVYVYERGAGGVWGQVAELNASDGQANDAFGFSAAIDNDTAVIGAIGASGRNLERGAAYVLERIGGAWSELTKLEGDGTFGLTNLGQAVAISHGNVLATDPTFSNLIWGGLANVYGVRKTVPNDQRMSNEQFGIATAISGDTAVVLTPFDQVGGVYPPTNPALFFFQRTAGSWEQVAKLSIPDAISTSGSAEVAGLALEQGRAVVGLIQVDLTQPWNTLAWQGVVVVCERIAGQWAEVTRIHPPDQNQHLGFGVQLGLSGDTLVVGGIDYGEAGEVFVYERIGSSWVLTAQLHQPVGYYPYNTGFGQAVAVSGNHMVIGAPGDGATNNNVGPGAAYFYERIGGAWTLASKVTGSSAYYSAKFGAAVALQGDRAVIGAPGTTEAFVFERQGGVWSETAQLPEDNAEGDFGNLFGQSVALDGDVALVGAPNGWWGGAIQEFRFQDGHWGDPFIPLIRAVDWDDYYMGYPQGFGCDVALSGGTAVIGWPLDDNARGSVYFLDLIPEPSIVTGPVDHSVPKGDPVSFNVNAAGAQPLFYQWQRDGVPLVDDGRISGASSATLTLAFALPGDSGNYEVTVSNGCGAATSSSAMLHVYQPAGTQRANPHQHP